MPSTSPDRTEAPQELESTSAPKNGYEVVTTEYTHAQINPVLLGQTVIFCRWLIWFLGGGPQAAILRKSPFANSAHLRASPTLSA
jgi:hypothetical protein